LRADVNHLYRLGSDLLRTNNFDQASYGAGGWAQALPALSARRETPHDS
jgi:hypothetical protein